MWDEDYLLQPDLDGDPEESHQFTNAFGISENYFVAIAPDPPAKEIAAIFQKVKTLCG